MYEPHPNLNPHGAIGQPSPSIGVIGKQSQAIDNFSPAPAAAHARQLVTSLSQGGRPRTPINRDRDISGNRDVLSMGETREQGNMESDLTNLLAQARLHRTGLFSDREIHSQPHSPSRTESQSRSQSQSPMQPQRQYQSQPQSQEKDDTTGGIDDFRKRWERESGEGGKRFDEETWDRNGVRLGMSTVQRQGRGSPAPGGFGIGLSGVGMGSGFGLGGVGAVSGGTQSKTTTGTIPSYQSFMDKISPVSSAQYRPSLSPSNHYLPSSTYGNQASSQSQPYSRPQTPSHTAAPTTLLAGLGGQNDTATQITRHLESLTILLNPLVTQADEVERLRKEVEMWKSEWARAERERKRLEDKVGGMGMDLEKAVGKRTDNAGPSFTAVLINGDDLIFQDTYLQSGFKGGQLAAKHLLSSISNLAVGTSLSRASNMGFITEEVILGLDGLPVNRDKGRDNSDGGDGAKTEKGGREMGNVVVQIFVNKRGLGEILVKHFVQTILFNELTFWEIVCDIGQGKEASDAKIREYLRLYASNAQCRSIILGASHDNGYANVLSTLEEVPPPLPSFTSITADSISAIQAGDSPDLISSVSSVGGISFSSVVAGSPKDNESDIAGSYNATIRDNATTATPTRNISLTAIEKAGISTPKREEEESEEEIEEFEYEWGSGAQFKGRSDLASGFAPVSGKKKASAPYSRVGGKDREMDDEWTEMTPKKKTKGKRKEAAEYVRSLKPRPCHT
ncbi:Hypothetical Protein CGB_K4360C [Cryptococcus gattii WM276]|uniref:DUF7923 domain-containing protein n=1 Tax=Cryptococcus gattii serotype B (strain WM276 / ATCC MYA-4071) TaxID=367775 RepID=E6RE08_CRYGW|nr:Hypothetical Protein CGB_K4360C [Cryptococcus gattii WM276]ADV25070.1 Hypothetical Protein CGB_K4360C [Cryptococcus gattii WM276]